MNTGFSFPKRARKLRFTFEMLIQFMPPRHEISYTRTGVNIVPSAGFINKEFIVHCWRLRDGGCVMNELVNPFCFWTRA